MVVLSSKARISIHALREEGDVRNGASCHQRNNFYPRPPRGGRRSIYQNQHQAILISIHALREEGDANQRPRRTKHKDFYPRPPRGGRHRIMSMLESPRLFLSTPSARRATASTPTPNPRPTRFLSTPSARRATWGISVMDYRAFVFLSTPSARRATEVPGMYAAKSKFLSTPSARRATRVGCGVAAFGVISIHALREEGDVSSC